MDETFLLSNIAPQVGVGFNRHCSFCHLFFFFFCLHAMLILSLLLLRRAIRRLGLPRRLVSPVDGLLFRRLRVHDSIVPPAQGPRWKMASCEFCPPNKQTFVIDSPPPPTYYTRHTK